MGTVVTKGVLVKVGVSVGVSLGCKVRVAVRSSPSVGVGDLSMNSFVGVIDCVDTVSGWSGVPGESWQLAKRRRLKRSRTNKILIEFIAGPLMQMIRRLRNYNWLNIARFPVCQHLRQITTVDRTQSILIIQHLSIKVVGDLNFD